MSAPLRLVRPGAARTASQFDVAPNPVWLQQLIEMGFEKRQCEKALIETRNSSLQAAMDWIFSHPLQDSAQNPDSVEVDDPEILPDSQEMNPPSPVPSNPVHPAQTTTTTTATTASPPMGASLSTERRSESSILDEHGRIRMIYEDGTSLSSGGTKLRGFTPEEKMTFQEKQRRKHEEEVRRERQAKAQDLKLLRERMEQEKKERLNRSRQAIASASASTTTTQVAPPIAADNLDAEQDADLLQQIANKAAGKTPLHVPALPAAVGASSSSSSSSSSSTATQVCVLQIRFPDGSTQKQEFRADDPLQTVHDFVLSKMISSNPTDSATQFTLIMPFPRKEFGAETMSSSLRDCGLCPRAQLIVQKTEDRGIVRKGTHSNRHQFGGSGGDDGHADSRSNPFSFAYPRTRRPDFGGDDEDSSEEEEENGDDGYEDGGDNGRANYMFGGRGGGRREYIPSYEENLALAERLGSVERGLDFDQLAQIPISIFTAGGTAATTFETAHRCAICMTDYEAQQEIVTLPCGHQFHKACCYTWCKSHRNCPYCKSHIVAGGQQRHRSS